MRDRRNDLDADREREPAGGPPGAATVAHANRLADEKSPYLLQHAHNPVDWYPWGEEAFARAKADDKPIFLSIGYSTCHWCHVMERESFEDAAIAELLNEHFVAIKVDREERPDVDRVYMTYVQAATGSGGWPLTVFLTPDLQPFLGGTYFPPEGRYGMPGLREVLLKVLQAWRTERERLLKSARKVTAALQESQAAPEQGGPAVGPAEMAKAYEHLRLSYDGDHAGFGRAPKFPQPVVLGFLLRYHARTGDADARDMVLQTLRAMAEGGVHDQLGGGFHRYSTDDRWFLPHFEKMLYDQAQLTIAYVEAYQVSRDSFYAEVARDVLDYVLKEMTGPAGQFYSAQDADSAVDYSRPHEKAEGRYYVWTADEIREALGPEQAALAACRYGALPGGNVAEDPHEEFAGRNVLYAARGIEETARRFGLPPAQVRMDLAGARRRLLEARRARPGPLLDDKTLVSWNGLMISACARAGAVLGEARYQQAAAKAAGVIRRELYRPRDGTLYRRLREGEAKVEGFLDDYAFYIQGLIDLYESTFDAGWIALALELQRHQDERFWDAQAGGYFSTAGRDGSILLRFKDASDGAEPSGNSVAVMNLLRLGQMTGDAELLRKAQRALECFAPQMHQYAVAMPQMLSAADFHRGPPVQIVLAGRMESPDLQALLREVHAHYIPNKVLLLAGEDEGRGHAPMGADYLKIAHPIGGKAAAYVCRDFTCRLPATDPSELRKILAENAGVSKADP
jgi:uncharacterized protein YyaL (SSP411 family)